MKALVTGASGFIGTHLCKKLWETGWELRPEPYGCDVIFHLAAIKDGDMWGVNVGGTSQILEMGREYGVKRVVFTSSCAAANPVNDYGKSKQLAEELCEWYREFHGLETVVLRLFNVYGPGDTKSDVARFAEAIRAGVPPVIYGGDCLRDYVHVDDVVKALTVAATENPIPPGPVEVGTGVPTSIRELWRLCKEATGSELEALFEPSGRNAVRYAVARYYGGPTISLGDGLKTVLPVKELCESC